MMCGPTGAFSGKGFDRAGLHGAHHSWLFSRELGERVIPLLVMITKFTKRS